MKNVLLLTGFLVLPLAAAEYFTAPFGSDLGPGSEKSPFKTVGRGVKALKPGDTLTISPAAIMRRSNGNSTVLPNNTPRYRRKSPEPSYCTATVR